MVETKEFYNNYVADQVKGFVSLQESLNKHLTEENEQLKLLLYDANNAIKAED